MAQSKKRKASCEATSKDRKRTRAPSATSLTRLLTSRSPGPILCGSHCAYTPDLRDKRAVPTDGDYKFRLKIISSSADLDDDIFREAVQGLVQICFPSGILEDLGIKVLEQHMAEEKASSASIARMQETFRAEMVHRVPWMLAEYLDTTDKLHSGITSVITATNQLHGDGLDTKGLDGVISALQAFRGQLAEAEPSQMEPDSREINPRTCRNDPRHPSRQISDSVTIDSVTIDSVTIDSVGSSEIVQSKGAEITKNVQHAKKAMKTKKHESTASGEAVECEREKLVPDSAQPRANHGTKKNKVSSSWRWDVNSDDINPDVISSHFKRKIDLFAFHALPIVKQQLSSLATKRELRKEIEVKYAEMSQDEQGKWEWSFQQLLKGDMAMLSRSSPEEEEDIQSIAQTTPAPPTRYIPVAGSEPRGSGTTTRPNTIPQIHIDGAHGELALVPNNVQVIGGPEVKQELLSAAAAPSSGLQHESDSNRQARPSDNVTSQDPMLTQGDLHHTPVIDLLYGRSCFTRSDRIGVVGKIMHELNTRVLVESILVSRINGNAKTETKPWLKEMLFHAWPAPSQPFDHKEVREMMEAEVVPWITGNPGSFPELKKTTYFFANMMPQVTPVLDLFIKPQVSLHRIGVNKTLNQINAGLSTRKIFSTHASAHIYREEFRRDFFLIMTNGCMRESWKRHMLEKTLRRIAFNHYGKFPELRCSTLVKKWECITGIRW